MKTASTPASERTRSRLANGLEVVCARQPHLHSATASVIVKVGSRYEDDSTNGISHFLEHMLFRGTSRYPSSYELNLAIEELGGTLYAATHVDHTLYQLSLPPETLATGLALLGEIFQDPTLSGIDSEKAIVREEILEELDEEGNDIDVDNLSRRLMFAPDPLGYKIIGSVDRVDSFGLPELKAHLERHYVAANMVVSLAGAIEETELLDAVERHFGSLPRGTRTHVPNLLPRHPGDRFLYVENSGSQTDVRLSFHAMGEADPRFLALQMLARVLDDGMSTRLHRRICDEKGLAYHAFAGLDPYEDRGVFDVGATVEHAKTPLLLAELLTLLRELRDVPVERAELEKAKRRYQWELRTALDDDDGLSVMCGAQVLLGVEQSLNEISERVAAVTSKEIQEAANAVVQSPSLFVTCVGVVENKDLDESRAIVERFQ